MGRWTHSGNAAYDLSNTVYRFAFHALAKNQRNTSKFRRSSLRLRILSKLKAAWYYLASGSSASI
jgi:hypothetical protein